MSIRLNMTKNRGSIYVYDDKDVFVGIIKPVGSKKHLRIYQSNNYFSITDTFFINYEILSSPHLQYDQIDIKFKHKIYSTTRLFWLKHGHRTLNTVFLSKNQFGIGFAKAWESYTEAKELAEKYDIFDMYKHRKILNKWIEAIEHVEDYYFLKQIKQKRKY